MAHVINDNQIVADRSIQLAHAAVRDNMKISETFGRFSDETFKGRANEPVFVRVKKPTVKAREYPLYNNREQPIKMDFMEEKLVPLKVDRSRFVSAVGIRDEVVDFDFEGDWGEVLLSQAEAMSSHFENAAMKLLFSSPYEYVKHIEYTETAIKKAISLNQDLLYNALTDARTALSKMSSPLSSTTVFAVAGSEWAGALRKNQKLVLVTGDNTPTAFADASVGIYAGVNIIESFDIPANELYLYTREAFLLWSAAPGVPRGAVKGAPLNDAGLAMTWIQDYDGPYALDRSMLWSYGATGNTLDFVTARNNAGGLTTSEEQYFIRGAKLVLGSGTDIEPGSGKGDTPGANPDSVLAKLYTNTLVTGTQDNAIFADLTYQNVVSGNVAEGKAADLTIKDNVKRVRKAADTPADIPAEEG